MLQQLRPLLTRTAQEELERVPAARWRVDLDDLVAEGAVGIMKGWHRFRPGLGRSDSSYLMLWARTEMRRYLERNAHDLAVDRAVSQRARKVRAVRARLQATNPGELTEADDLIAASQQTLQHRYGAARSTPLSPLTMSDVNEEAALATRLIPMQRLDEHPVDQAAACVTAAVPAMDSVPQQGVVEQLAAQALAQLVNDAIHELGLDEVERMVITLTYGLPPSDNSHSIRQVSQRLGLDRRRTSRILSTFNTAMSRPDGPMMRRLLTLSLDDLAALGLLAMLGSAPLDRDQRTETARVHPGQATPPGGSPSPDQRLGP